MKKLLLSALLLLSGIAFADSFKLIDYPEDGLLSRMPGTVCEMAHQPGSPQKLYKLIAKFKDHEVDIFDKQFEDETEIKVYQRLDLTAAKKYIVRENIKRYSWTGNSSSFTGYKFDSLEEIKEQFKDKFEIVIEKF